MTGKRGNTRRSSLPATTAAQTRSCRQHHGVRQEQPQSQLPLGCICMRVTVSVPSAQSYRGAYCDNRTLLTAAGTLPSPASEMARFTEMNRSRRGHKETCTWAQVVNASLKLQTHLYPPLPGDRVVISGRHAPGRNTSSNIKNRSPIHVLRLKPLRGTTCPTLCLSNAAPSV